MFLDNNNDPERLDVQARHDPAGLERQRRGRRDRCASPGRRRRGTSSRSPTISSARATARTPSRRRNAVEASYRRWFPARALVAGRLDVAAHQPAADRGERVPAARDGQARSEAGPGPADDLGHRAGRRRSPGSSTGRNPTYFDNRNTSFYYRAAALLHHRRARVQGRLQRRQRRGRPEPDRTRSSRSAIASTTACRTRSRCFAHAVLDARRTSTTTSASTRRIGGRSIG